MQKTILVVKCHRASYQCKQKKKTENWTGILLLSSTLSIIFLHHNSARIGYATNTKGTLFISA